MKKVSIQKTRLGILGGGQLGKMLVAAASKWNIKTYVLDPNIDGPASETCTRFVLGDFTDEQFVYDLGERVDMITIEIENVDTAALMKLKEEGKLIYPSPENIRIVQDKGLQKQFFTAHDIPTAPYEIYKSRKEILEALRTGKLRVPFVQKLRTSGYDGRGVQVIKSEVESSDLLKGASVVEEYTNIDKEISVIVARNVSGDIVAYPPVEMIFNPQANLVEYLLSPARIGEAKATEATAYAKKIIGELEMVGVLAVEMFIDKQGTILVNEVAPRPHNSGHHTIEANYTSQYEQHIRAIYDLPLGSTGIIKPAVMVNLLGEPGYKGPAIYDGMEEVLKMEGVNIYIYGKANTRPYRKMGHVTIMADTVEAALEKARKVHQTLKVISDATKG